MMRKVEYHGLSRSSEYETWNRMKARCYNPKDPSYKYYGGRGITVCERWRNSFLAFLEDMGKRSGNLTLERKDNNGNYELDNCKWATWTEQQRNRTDNHFLEFNGRKMCITDWAKELRIKPQGLFNRLRRGWSVERALTTKVKA